MKKLMIAAFAVALLLGGATSCSTVKKSSSTQDVMTTMQSGNEADLVVSPTKISFHYNVPKNVRRGGNKSALQTAVAEALKANGNADVLVHAQFETRSKRGSIREITVTGYPVTYRNFRQSNFAAPIKCEKGKGQCKH